MRPEVPLLHQFNLCLRPVYSSLLIYSVIHSLNILWVAIALKINSGKLETRTDLVLVLTEKKLFKEDAWTFGWPPYFKILQWGSNWTNLWKCLENVAALWSAVGCMHVSFFPSTTHWRDLVPFISSEVLPPSPWWINAHWSGVRHSPFQDDQAWWSPWRNTYTQVSLLAFKSKLEASHHASCCIFKLRRMW